MNILSEDIKTQIRQGIVNNIIQGNPGKAADNISCIIDALHASIPDNKRISYGIVHTVKVLSKFLFEFLVELKIPVFETASVIFNKNNNFKSRAVSLGILSFYGLSDSSKTLPYFEEATSSEDWNEREIAQMLFRKLIKKYPAEMKDYLMLCVKSNNPYIRRFVGETLRPVCENRWFYKSPDYSLSILKNLFQESNPYPRTSVGNNLSDLARWLPNLVYELVRYLVNTGDKNSYWIAYRACRNLVKKEPEKIMDLLKVDNYKYKKSIYKLNY